MKKILFACLLAAACSKAKPSSPSEPSLSNADVFKQLAERLPAFAPDGFIVSLSTAGDVIQQGNSLLFTAIALAGLPCDTGAPIAARLQQMLADERGGLIHYPTVTDIDLDDAIGFYRAVSDRMQRCGDAAAWAPGLALHAALAPSISSRMIVNLDYPFSWLRKATLHQAGIGAAPSANDQAFLEAAVASWASAAMKAKAACYRVHLGLQTLQAIEASGHSVSSEGRNAFCSATNGSGIATVEHWCGRSGLQEYLDGFQENQWQYKFQRCPGWESPDGDGNQHPGIDYIIGFSDISR